MNLFITCKPDFEKILSRELVLYHLTPQKNGRGWILASTADAKATVESARLNEACFPYLVLANPIEVQAASVNALTEKFIELFIADIGERRIENLWPFSFIACDEEQAAHRAKTVEKEWREKIAKRLSRVAKLSRPEIPYSPVFVPGFFVCFTDIDQAFVGFQALSGG